MEIQKTVVAVIGAGTMGQGIAQVCALSGYKVLVYDASPIAARTAIETIAATLETLLTKGKITSLQKESSVRNIQFAENIRALHADFVIEAVVEDLDVKQKLFTELESVVNEKTLLLSNTSSISIAQISAKMKHPGRFAGLHFFNPASVMKLVEVVKGAATSDETVDSAVIFARSLGKQAVVAQDSPGFIVNRVARLFYVEALKVLEEGMADHQTIDKLMKNAGFRMGPFELMDLIGIDVNLSVTKSMYHAFFNEPRFRPSRIQQQKVDAGLLGRKTGKGFYDHA